MDSNKTNDTLETSTQPETQKTSEPAKKKVQFNTVSVSKDTGHVIRKYEEQWDKTRIRFDNFVERKVQGKEVDASGKPVEIVSYSARISYDYGTPEKPDVRPLKVESPKTTSPYCVGPKQSGNGHSVSCYYDSNLERDKFFLEVIMNDIHVAAANFAAENPPSDKISFDFCDENVDIANPNSSLNYPVKYKKEALKKPEGAPKNYKQRYGIVAGSKPYVPFDVNLEGSKKSNFHLQRDPKNPTADPVLISKEVLKHVGIIHYPIIHVGSIFASTVAKKVKMTVSSSLVVDLMEPDAVDTGELMNELSKEGLSTGDQLTSVLEGVMNSLALQANDKEKAKTKAPESATPQTPQPTPQNNQPPPPQQPNNQYAQSFGQFTPGPGGQYPPGPGGQYPPGPGGNYAPNMGSGYSSFHGNPNMVNGNVPMYTGAN